MPREAVAKFIASQEGVAGLEAISVEVAKSQAKAKHEAGKVEAAMEIILSMKTDEYLAEVAFGY